LLFSSFFYLTFFANGGGFGMGEYAIMDTSLLHYYLRASTMGLKERFGCFFLAIGIVAFLLFAVPVVRAFQKNPGTVPVEWIGIALVALLVFWMGWKLYRSARASAESQKPPTLGARIAGRWKSDGTGERDNQRDRRG
jgi:hypothetical protein